jgi:hypothetical protein
MKRFEKLSDLRPCDNCRGPVARGFVVVNVSRAMLAPAAANQVLGLTQLLGGSLPLAEQFAPSNPVMVFGDHNPDLYCTIILCQGCWLDKPIDLALLWERVHAEQKEGA